jgi:hypothetical protein
MGSKLLPGQLFPRLQSNNIHGVEVSVPDSTTWTHVQFRRFAGCSICNLHLQSFLARQDEIANAGIREVVIFHSSDAELLPYQGASHLMSSAIPERRCIEGTVSKARFPPFWHRKPSRPH